MAKRIYFFRPAGAVGPIKIGCSHFPDVRLKAFAKWSPTPLELIVSAPGSKDLERYLHRRFAASRSHLEWFFVSDDLLKAIARIVAGESPEDAFEVVGKPGRPKTYGGPSTDYFPRLAA